jgi:hypothetical protein
MAKKKSQKGLVLSREALIHARKVKHNFTQDGLADAMQIHVREIQRAEGEKPIHPDFAHRLADFLGENLDDLLKKTARRKSKKDDPPDESPLKSFTLSQYDDRLVVTIVVNKKVARTPEWDASEFMRFISDFLGFKDGFNVREFTVTTGSLRISLPLSRTDAALLTKAFTERRLDSANVVAVTVALPEMGPPEVLAADEIRELASRVLSDVKLEDLRREDLAGFYGTLLRFHQFVSHYRDRKPRNAAAEFLLDPRVWRMPDKKFD